MSPRLEFLAYFLVLLVGLSAYLFEARASGPLFVAVVAAHLFGLRFLCGQLAKRFTFDRSPARAEP